MIIVAFGCVRLLQASNDLHASKNAKIAIIPEEKDNLIHFNAKVQEDVEKLTSKIDQVYEGLLNYIHNHTNIDNLKMNEIFGFSLQKGQRESSKM